MALIPKPTAPIAGALLITREWWNYLSQIPTTFNVDDLSKQLAEIQRELAELSKPGRQPVKSVNGKYGTVVLDAGDVGADPVGAAAGAVAEHVAEPDPHPQYVEEAPEDGGLYARKDGDWSLVQAQQEYQRMTADGDFRVTTDGSLRITD